MKNLLVVIFSLIAINSTGQEKLTLISAPKIHNDQFRTQTDTIVDVVYRGNRNNSDRPDAIFLNGKFTKGLILQSLNLQLIDSLYVKKEDIEIENKKYYAQMYIWLKKGCTPRLVSLSDMKEKYAGIYKLPAVFLLNNEVIKGNYDTCFVDESYILKIIITDIRNQEENLHFNLVNLLTKTEENITKSKEIRIRGNFE